MVQKTWFWPHSAELNVFCFIKIGVLVSPEKFGVSVSRKKIGSFYKCLQPQIIWKPLTNFGYFSFRRIFAASEPLVILLIFNEKHAKTKREIASEAVES